VPKLSAGETTVVARHRRSFSNAHAYLINSISTCADGETFLSADDLRINVWSLDSTKSSFSAKNALPCSNSAIHLARCADVVDMKPGSMEDLTEVISTAQYHPTHAHNFAFGSSIGLVRLADMRASALCDSGAKGIHPAHRNVARTAQHSFSCSFFWHCGLA
jgi:serine/threonine-protein phosphatase 2A regulatory subunit B